MPGANDCSELFCVGNGGVGRKIKSQEVTGNHHRKEKRMSNTRAWRLKSRTGKPNSRQKRNGLLLDARPTCERCRQRASREAHHTLPKGESDRNDPAHMQALCLPCHTAVHADRARSAALDQAEGRSN
jgi:hypothetical protein